MGVGQSWCTGWSTCLPVMFPRSEFKTSCQIWVELVAPLLSSMRFFHLGTPVLASHQKQMCYSI